MANQELVNYIRSNLQEGVPLEQIKESLLAQGWSDYDINEAVGLIQGESKSSKKIRIFSIIFAVIIISSIFAFFMFSKYPGVPPPKLPKPGLQTSKVIDTNIQSPHPYPNSDGGKVIVWSETIEHPGATSLRLHFNKFEIKGTFNTPVIWEEVDYGECNLTAPEGYERKLIDPNTIIETPIVEQKPGELPRIGHLRTIKCGIVREKKQYTPQEIFDNYNEYIKGDFVAIKDKDGKVLDILVKDSLPNFNGSPSDPLKQDVWGKTYSNVDYITIELYADESDNGFGLYIDKYVAGFRRRIDEDNK